MTDRIVYPAADALGYRGIPLLEGGGMLDAALDCRIAMLTEWLENHAPSSREELARLDPAVREQLFWNHGYLVALRSVRSYVQRRRRVLN
jgi:hypothetical protein